MTHYFCPGVSSGQAGFQVSGSLNTNREQASCGKAATVAVVIKECGFASEAHSSVGSSSTCAKRDGQPRRQSSKGPPHIPVFGRSLYPQ